MFRPISHPWTAGQDVGAGEARRETEFIPSHARAVMNLRAASRRRASDRA
jgi:hypothetical protein